MARADLGLGVRELGELAGVAAMTVTRFENGRSSGAKDSQRKIRRALKRPASSSLRRTAVEPG
jgi:transcriptional regulator with XRE-family HTH domain